MAATMLVVAPGGVTPAGAATFPDVPDDHPFVDEIEWLVAEGVTTGYDDGTFRPTNDITRGAMAAFFYRYIQPVGFTPPATPSFTDVPITHPFFLEIEWLAQSGITTGFDDDTFRPGASITRQAIAAFVFRIQDDGTFEPPATPTFSDVPTSSLFYEAIEWLAETGITTGFDDGTFRPTNRLTRQAIAAFLFRYDEQFGTDDELPPDPSTIAPAIDPTVTPTLADTTSFLYTGSNPIQKGVAPGTIDPDLVAVVRGRVLDLDGEAMPGVTVTVGEHDQYGSTLTRADGGYDLAVNADRHHTIRFEADGYPTVQRLARVEPGEWTVLDDVVLTPYDTKSTEIDVDSTEAQTHVATPSSDADGPRTAALLVPKSTGAELVMPDGTTDELDTMTVRATEYTVGGRGPNAMPGDLPSNSAYTYAVELSVDEAVAAGARSVRFDQPVVNYTDNFIGFPAGTAVPNAWYDQVSGQWIPNADGVVIDIVAESSGAAQIDLDGDGTAEPNGELDAFGIDADERQALADLYAPGDSLWRVTVTHFSPYDHNWSAGCSGTDCQFPGSPPNGNDPAEDGCTQNGSVILCQDQVLGEMAPVAGTPYSMVYSSDRVPGRVRGRTITIPVTPASPPAELQRVDVTIDIAGQHEMLTFGPEPNQTHIYTWDGKDVYGRDLPSSQHAVVTVRNVYKAEYIGDPFDGDVVSWSSPSDGIFGGYDRTTSEFTAGIIVDVQLDNRNLSGNGLGAWTVDVHHRFDPVTGQLILGNGVTREAREQYVTKPLAGDGEPCAIAGCGDGGPASQAQVAARVMAVHPMSGLLHFFDEGTWTIRRINDDGTIESVFGTGVVCLDNPVGCGTDADDLSFGQGGVSALGFDPDGTLFALDGPTSGEGGEFPSTSPVLRSIAPDGTVEHVAGSGLECTDDVYPTCGDGSPADSASLRWADDITITPDGTVYILDGPSIRRVVGGIISHAYGCPDPFCADAEEVNGGPAAFARMSPTSLEAGPDGSLYITDLSGNGVRGVRRITPDGIITRVSGSVLSNSCKTGEQCGDGMAALFAQHNNMSALAVDPDGNVWVADVYYEGTPGFGTVLRRFVPGSVIDRFAGNGKPCGDGYQPGDCGDNGLARNSSFYNPIDGMTSGPDGELYFYDWEANAIRVIERRPETAIPSLDGYEAYEFDQQGRHLRTRDTITGEATATFGYDDEGRLITITDEHGNVTTVQRNTSGAPTAIVGPYGHTTPLTLGGDGYLASITDPLGQTINATYDPEGLLQTFADRNGNVSSFTYDDLGALTKDENAAGGSSTLERTPIANGFRVTVTSAEGRATAYEMFRDPLFQTDVRRRIDPSGAVTTMTTDPDGDVHVTYPDGRIADITYQDDPRWGREAALVREHRERSPGGTEMVTAVTRDVTLADPADPVVVTSFTETGDRNGDVAAFEYDAASRTATWVSPTGRTRTQTYDEMGETLTVAPDPSVAPVVFTYDSHGRRATTTVDKRVTTYTYDTESNLTSLIDPTGDVATMDYDDGGRRTSVTTAGNATWTYAYDPNGNLTSVLTPTGQTHTPTYDEVNNPAGWTGPGLGAEILDRNLDQDLVTQTLPGGDAMTRSYDGGGRVSGETTASAVAAFGYVGTTERVGATSWDPTGPGTTQGLTYQYDGLRTTRMTFTGPGAGQVQVGYDDEFKVDALTITSGVDNVSLPLAHDADGWITGYGGFTFTRGGPAGAATEISDGTGTQTLTYDQYGDWDQRTTTVDGTTVYDIDLVRDDDGRVVQKTETTPGGTDTTTYSYDPDGRLRNVVASDASSRVYTYDANGNPVSGPSGLATYDAGDRVTSVDGTTYTYDTAGRLTGRGSDTFAYTARGELLTATVDGETVRYTYDALGRRTARTDDQGTTTYLYGNPANALQVTASRADDGTFSVYLYDEADALFGIKRGGATFYVATDQIDTPRVVADASGTVALERNFDAWGNTVDETGTFDLPIGFAGGIADPDTGLVRFGARDYDPASGRWTTPDPALFEGSLNLYEYVMGDPQNLTDPTGMFCVGGTFYEGIGGGLEYCIDSPWSASICFEVGVGLGGGIGLSNGSSTQSGAGFGAEAGGDCGGFGAGVSAEAYINDCLEASSDYCGSAMAGGLTGKACVNGGTSLSWSPVDVANCSLGAKAYVKSCLHS
jgi:RHS repeat-associated protein